MPVPPTTLHPVRWICLTAAGPIIPVEWEGTDAAGRVFRMTLMGA